MSVHIEEIGGNCPVQAHGNVDGRAFYFRARGSSWSLELQKGDDCEVFISCHYGPRYSAGWMPEEDAIAIIEAAAPVLMPILALPNRRDEPDPAEPGDAAFKAMMSDSRERAELIVDNAALRERIKQLESRP